MSLNDFIFGTPPQTTVATTPGFRAPGYDFARQLSQHLRGLIGAPTPSYPGQIDPGLSPTMQTLGRMVQGYSSSPAPHIMGQAAGVLGQYMNPTFGSPIEALQRPVEPLFGGASPGGRPGVMPQEPTSQGAGFSHRPMAIPPWLAPGGENAPGWPGTSGGLLSAPAIDFQGLEPLKELTNGRPAPAGPAFSFRPTPLPPDGSARPAWPSPAPPPMQSAPTPSRSQQLLEKIRETVGARRRRPGSGRSGA